MEIDNENSTMRTVQMAGQMCSARPMPSMAEMEYRIPERDTKKAEQACEISQTISMGVSHGKRSEMQRCGEIIGCAKTA